MTNDSRTKIEAHDKTVAFVRERVIRFHHCDPAGIVFYPQYLVMLHEFIERWFDEGLDIPYCQFIGHQRLGIPVVRLDCEFFAPSRLGDRVEQSLVVRRLGNSSIDLDLDICGTNRDGAVQVRMRARQTLVLMSLDTHNAVSIPPLLRERMSGYLPPASIAQHNS